MNSLLLLVLLLGSAVVTNAVKYPKEDFTHPPYDEADYNFPTDTIEDRLGVKRVFFTFINVPGKWQKQ